MIRLLRALPALAVMLSRLVSDPALPRPVKIALVAAVVYLASPIDLIPDFIPFLGEVDDVFLLVLALRRLLRNAGRTVLLAHWTGDPAELRDLNLRKALMAAAFFLPRRVRRRLRVLGKA